MKILLDYDAAPRVALRVLGVLAIAAAVSIPASPLAGSVVVALGLLVLILDEAIRPRGTLREAELAVHPHGGARHVLVVADAPITGDDVAETITDIVGPHAKLDILAPVLVSPSHYLASDDDGERRRATARLRSALAWAADHGFEARGEVGDDEPGAAIADELRDFGAEAVVVVTSDERGTRWAERRELERARSELGIPLVQVAAHDSVTPTGALLVT